MKESIDVKNVFDIPLVVKNSEAVMDLLLYDIGDETATYEHKLNDDTSIIVDVISKEPTYFSDIKLHDLASFDDIQYLSIGLCIDIDVIESYCYRPLIAEDQKNY